MKSQLLALLTLTTSFGMVLNQNQLKLFLRDLSTSSLLPCPMLLLVQTSERLDGNDFSISLGTILWTKMLSSLAQLEPQMLLTQQLIWLLMMKKLKDLLGGIFLSQLTSLPPKSHQQTPQPILLLSWPHLDLLRFTLPRMKSILIQSMNFTLTRQNSPPP